MLPRYKLVLRFGVGVCVGESLESILFFVSGGKALGKNSLLCNSLRIPLEMSANILLAI